MKSILNLIFVTFFVFISACNNAQKVECICNTQNATCKIYLDTLSVDSVTVFTEKYNSPNIVDWLSNFELDSIRCLSKLEIEKSEQIIRDNKKLLQSFLLIYGEEPQKEFFPSGYYKYGEFQLIPITEYKRQYFGVIDKQKRNKVLLILLNAVLTTKPSVLEDWNMNNMISRPITCPPDGYETVFFTFLIDLKKSTINIIPL